MRFAAIATWLFAVAIQCAAQTVVVLPFDNVSGAARAPSHVREQLSKGLESRGWKISDADVLPLLEQLRVRYFESLDDDVRKKVVEATHAATVLTGTIYTYTDGKNPIVSIAARLVRADGSIAWGDVAGVSADDAEELFGFRRSVNADALAIDAVRQLLDEFPEPGRESAPPKGPSKALTPLFRGAPVSYRAADLDPNVPHRVCVLPLENVTRTPDAARVFAEVLTLRLAAAEGFEPVEPARLRAAALQAKVGSFITAGPAELRKLGDAVGTSLFLRGTVWTYDDVTDRGITTPAVQVELTLVDVETGRVLWAAQHERKGDDYAGLLMIGAVSNAVSLADRVVSEMISMKGRSHETNDARIAAARARLIRRSADARPRQ